MTKIIITLEEIDECVQLNIKSEGLKESSIAVQAFAASLLLALRKETEAMEAFGKQVDDVEHKSYLN